MIYTILKGIYELLLAMPRRIKKSSNQICLYCHVICGLSKKKKPYDSHRLRLLCFLFIKASRDSIRFWILRLSIQLVFVIGLGMAQAVEEWYKQMPIITRSYLTAAVVTTVGCSLKVYTLPLSLFSVSPSLFVLSEPEKRERRWYLCHYLNIISGRRNLYLRCFGVT